VIAEDEPRITLTLSMREDAKYYVNKVLIRGNQHTKDHVIRREITLLPGDVANADEVEETLDREEVLEQAPDREGPYFRVPPFMEEA
jgi:outer membrane protein assembly factor BamA